MKRVTLMVTALTLMLGALGHANADVVTLTFEGLQDLEPINN